jgi:hypothetical protein
MAEMLLTIRSLAAIMPLLAGLSLANPLLENSENSLVKRDFITCEGKNQIRYSAALSIVQELADSDNNFLLTSGQNNAYEYNGAYMTYCDQGYGRGIYIHDAAQYAFEIMDTCWTQQGQDNNVAEAGAYLLFEGSFPTGVLCLSNAKNPSWCGSECPNEK